MVESKRRGDTVGIRQSEQIVRSEFRVDVDGNPTGGYTLIEPPANGATTYINWQDGIIGSEGQNGAFVEDVLEAARQRLQFFQSTKFRCRENALAITKIEEALGWLDWRTRQRTLHGVENTYEVHE